MGVLIKDMDKPESCGKCFFRDGIFCKAKNYKRISYVALDGKIEIWCPLIEIHTPHGRLIDADKLKEVLEKNFGHTGGASVLAQLIDAQDTIQPEPHWIPVTERLPEEDGRYLVCGAKGGIYHANYRGRWWTQVGCGGKLVPSVVAWCELPEPYKGVTE